MDPNNHVVKLCAEGMQAEADGRLDEAKALYDQAWADHDTDLEACIAAHYVARHQQDLEDELRWNKVALERADNVDGDLVGGFYASLHLNMGHSYEKRGDVEAARDHLRQARDHLGAVPDGSYKEIVRRGIKNALTRISPTQPAGAEDS